MGALPKKKLTRARSGRKLVAYRLKPLHPSLCPQCRSAKLPHRVCPHCGFYKGRQVVKMGGETEEI
ncbi:MAG: 50S ribosomal protein L32 [Dehalococcoidia bacterium]|nr:50S ribosomal protein L32 [Chloroflexota bacterium]MCZ6867609.1 50S ribosomal protein L32 [Chloroflexota bacterium]